MNLNDIKKAVVEALEDIKAYDIEIIDVRKITTVTSFMVIASANSIRQTKALAHNVCEKMKSLDIHINGVRCICNPYGYPEESHKDFNNKIYDLYLIK